MPLLCPDCGYVAEPDEPYCSQCGQTLVTSLRSSSGLPAPAQRDVLVDRFRVGYDPDIARECYTCGQKYTHADEHLKRCSVCNGKLVPAGERWAYGVKNTGHSL